MVDCRPHWKRGGYFMFFKIFDFQSKLHLFTFSIGVWLVPLPIIRLSFRSTSNINQKSFWWTILNAVFCEHWKSTKTEATTDFVKYHPIYLHGKSILNLNLVTGASTKWVLTDHTIHPRPINMSDRGSYRKESKAPNCHSRWHQCLSQQRDFKGVVAKSHCVLGALLNHHVIWPHSVFHWSVVLFIFFLKHEKRNENIIIWIVSICWCYLAIRSNQKLVLNCFVVTGLKVSLEGSFVH